MEQPPNHWSEWTHLNAAEFERWLSRNIQSLTPPTEVTIELALMRGFTAGYKAAKGENL